MKYLAILICGSFLAFNPRAAAEEKIIADSATREIPLKDVWAYEMPGTKNIWELQPKVDLSKLKSRDDLLSSSPVSQVTSILHVPERGEWAKPGFVVVGTGKEALGNALAVFSKNVEAPKVVPPDTELSLLFFAHAREWRPRIVSIQQSPRLITLTFQYVAPKEPAFAQATFAMIPLGKQSKGTVLVTIKQMPPIDYKGNPVTEKQDARQFVCGSFSFEVQ